MIRCPQLRIRPVDLSAWESRNVERYRQVVLVWGRCRRIVRTRIRTKYPCIGFPSSIWHWRIASESLNCRFILALFISTSGSLCSLFTLAMVGGAAKKNGLQMQQQLRVEGPLAVLRVGVSDAEAGRGYGFRRQLSGNCGHVSGVHRHDGFPAGLVGFDAKNFVERVRHALRLPTPLISPYVLRRCS